MKIKVVTSKMTDFGGSDIVLLSDEYRTIKYKKELSGENTELKTLAILSEKTSAVVICPFDTDNYGVFRHSAGVFDNGKLLGISDMTVTYEDSPYMPGVNAGTYETDFGKIAIAVGDDFYSYELLRSYAVCGVKVVFAIKRSGMAEMDRIVLRAYSYLLGIPVVLVAGERTVATDFKGNVVGDFHGEGDFSVEPIGEYYLKISRTRFSK